MTDMSGTIIQNICPKCRARSISAECPTCGFVLRSKGCHVTTGRQVAGPTDLRREAFAALAAQYLAENPGADPADVLQVSLWLAARRAPGAAE